MRRQSRKVDIRLPRRRNSNSHGARPVYQNCLHDYVDLYQQVVKEELSLRLPVPEVAISGSDRLRVGWQVPQEEKVLFEGTDPESYSIRRQKGKLREPETVRVCSRLLVVCADVT